MAHTLPSTARTLTPMAGPHQLLLEPTALGLDLTAHGLDFTTTHGPSRPGLHHHRRPITARTSQPWLDLITHGPDLSIQCPDLITITAGPHHSRPEPYHPRPGPFRWHGWTLRPTAGPCHPLQTSPWRQQRQFGFSLWVETVRDCTLHRGYQFDSKPGHRTRGSIWQGGALRCVLAPARRPALPDLYCYAVLWWGAGVLSEPVREIRINS